MALAKNPLPILIPCHRVVAASGHLTGFSAGDGLNSKAWLLQLEGHRVVTEKLA
jgi:methylated-DNA-[protein]-cysteine S-methyltransferase